MEIIIFGRFHARVTMESAIAFELRNTVTRVRTEPGCLTIEAYRSLRDTRLFWLHARWVDEESFDKHMERADTNQFIERVQGLIDHPFDVTRTSVLP